MRPVLHWLALAATVALAIAVGIGWARSAVLATVLALAGAVAVAFLVRTRAVRNGATLVAALLTTLLVAEGVLRLVKPVPGTGASDAHMQREEPQPLFVADPVTGWIPRPAATIRGVRARDGRVIYDATYTLDAVGRRITPGGDGPGDTILFLGDSFTFGDGVADADTLPARFAAATAGAFQVVNLGVSAYGPHQVLAQLRSGRVDAAVRGKVRDAILWVNDDHLARAAGHKGDWWWGTAPAFEIGPDGRPRHTGTLHEAAARRGFLDRRLSASMQGVELMRVLAPIPRSIHQIALLEALLTEIRLELGQRYGCGLTALYWTDDHAYGLYRSRVAAAIERSGATLVMVSDVLDREGLRSAEMRIPDDGHPNARFNAFLARLLAARHRP